jgi:Luciferase-like monooxygenase
MKVSISVGSAYYNGDNGEDLVEYVCTADRLGVDSVWSAEAWGMEAVASLGYLAARTEHIGLGTGIMQISARTPAATAMSAPADVLLDPIRHGAERAGRSLSDIDLQVNCQLEVSDDVDSLIARYRPAMAFTLGGMGSARTNFYNAAFMKRVLRDRYLTAI